MAKQDKTIPVFLYICEKLHKVPVTILHNTCPDHPRIPGPFDKHIGQDHILHADSQTGLPLQTP